MLRGRGDASKEIAEMAAAENCVVCLPKKGAHGKSRQVNRETGYRKIRRGIFQKKEIRTTPDTATEGLNETG